MNFYTYTYFIDGVPEYVGKGRGHRWASHMTDKESSYWLSHLRSSIQKLKTIKVAFVFVADDESAMTEERGLIALYGRRNLGTGTLYNLTAGGEGAAGCVRSPETRARIAAGQIGRPKTLGFTGRKVSDEHRAKISAATTGKKRAPFTDEHKANMAAARRGNQNARKHAVQ